MNGKQVTVWETHESGACLQDAATALRVAAEDTHRLLVDGHTYAVAVSVCNQVGLCSRPVHRTVTHYFHAPAPGHVLEVRGDRLDEDVGYWYDPTALRAIVSGAGSTGPVALVAMLETEAEANRCAGQEVLVGVAFELPFSSCTAAPAVGERVWIRLEATNGAGTTVSHSNGVRLTVAPGEALPLDVQDVLGCSGPACPDVDVQASQGQASSAWHTALAGAQATRYFWTLRRAADGVAVGATVQVGAHQAPRVTADDLELAGGMRYVAEVVPCNADYCFAASLSDGFTVEAEAPAAEERVVIAEAAMVPLRGRDGYFGQSDGADYQVSGALVFRIVRGGGAGSVLSVGDMAGCRWGCRARCRRRWAGRPACRGIWRRLRIGLSAPTTSAATRAGWRTAPGATLA